MENAIKDDKFVLAADISEDYELEKSIRKSSSLKELRCPDPDCQNPILRYCHGEIKGAYFAHITNKNCDYASFDKENTSVMRDLKRLIYHHFKSRGYKVFLEVKILQHHYTHLLLEMDDGSSLAIEIGTQQATASKVDLLTKAYTEKNVAVQWLVIGNTETIIRERHTYHMKRYLFNESTTGDLITINEAGTKVSQQRADFEEHTYYGSHVILEGYPDSYYECGTLDDLVFEGASITFFGFNERYNEWRIKKRAKFDSIIDQYTTRSRLISSEKRMLFSAGEKSFPVVDSKSTYDVRREEIMSAISQQEDPVYDTRGDRWIKCEVCGCVKVSDMFAFYGGLHRVNLGTCKMCAGQRYYV